jgi:hypothetical protein
MTLSMSAATLATLPPLQPGHLIHVRWHLQIHVHLMSPQTTPWGPSTPSGLGSGGSTWQINRWREKLACEGDNKALTDEILKKFCVATGLSYQCFFNYNYKDPLRYRHVETLNISDSLYDHVCMKQYTQTYQSYQVYKLVSFAKSIIKS